MRFLALHPRKRRRAHAAPVAARDLWPLWAQLGTLPVLAIRGALSDILATSEETIQQARLGTRHSS